MSGFASEGKLMSDEEFWKNIKKAADSGVNTGIAISVFFLCFPVLSQSWQASILSTFPANLSVLPVGYGPARREPIS